jgi:Icc-related predicted phosphoesterase
MRMMRIRVLSDLHFEFHRDAGASFVESLDPTGVDVLVVAGDLAVDDGIGPALDLLCARFVERAVVYVHGNHELYGTGRDEVLAITREAARRNGNLRWLDGDTVELGGRRFLGAPMWFPKPDAEGERAKYGLNDFRRIRDFESWVYAENARAIALFEKEMREGDIVVTHHLPSRASVAPQWVGSSLNPFFVCDVEPLIRARKPALWIHGHTHHSVDVRVGATRIVCNPFGYVRIEQNAGFDEAMTIEL